MNLHLFRKIINQVFIVCLIFIFSATWFLFPHEAGKEKILPFSEVIAFYGKLCQFPSLLTQAALSSLPRQAKKESSSKGRRNFDFFFMILSMGLLAGFVLCFHKSPSRRVKEFVRFSAVGFRTQFDIYLCYLRKLLKLVCLGMGGGAGISMSIYACYSRRPGSSAIIIL